MSNQAATSRTRLSVRPTRLLQVDPNNMKAIFASVYFKKQQCGQTLDASGVATDPQTCDDAAALAQKGLTAPKPAGMSDADWEDLTVGCLPGFPLRHRV